MTEEAITHVVLILILLSPIVWSVFGLLLKDDEDKTSGKTDGKFSETVEDMRRESRQLDADIKEAKEIQALEREIARKKETLEKCYEGEDEVEEPEPKTYAERTPFEGKIPLVIHWETKQEWHQMYFDSRAEIRRFLADLNRYSKERYTYYYPDE